MGRTSAKRICVASVVSVLIQLVVVLEAPAAQRSPDRGVGVVAEQAMRDVEIALDVVESGSGRTLRNHPTEVDELRVGDPVQICFRVSQPGYVSLWSQDKGAPPVQIYPNRFTAGSGLVDEMEHCLGRAGAGYSFEVQGPVGESLVFMHYSPDESNQISQEDYPVITRVRGNGFGPYASSTVSFRIVE